MNLSNPLAVETVLKETTSKCPVCRKPKPASVLKVVKGGREQVIMRRVCPCHGTHDFVIASDARFYWLAKGHEANRGEGCGCGTSCSSAGTGGRPGFLGDNALNEAKKGIIEKLSTCMALIEIVDSCNLACPTCFADSPLGTKGDKLLHKSFDELTARIQSVIDRKGYIDILQFSGGEPTIHPEFFRLVEWVRQNKAIKYLVINTNGVRFSHDEEFITRMGELQKTYDNIQLYLQFDGMQIEGQYELRGADLRATREKAIENCARIGLPITLAMTVNEANLPYLWDTVSFGLRYEHVRGVSFQPKFLSGRNPPKLQDAPLPQPITVADVVLGLNEQSEGAVSLDDFTPLPCGDPNCLIIGWRFRVAGRHFSPSAMDINVPELQKLLPDRINYRIEDLQKCGCDNTQLGELMKSFEVKESNAFRISVKPFMDERTWDEDRIDRCCTHVITPSGKLDSFCRYYYGSVNQEACC